MARVRLERIKCQDGNHHWERPVTRGRAPRNCDQYPNCPPDETAEEPQPRSKSLNIRLSNADVKFLMKKLANDDSEAAQRIKQELC